MNESDLFRKFWVRLAIRHERCPPATRHPSGLSMLHVERRSATLVCQVIFSSILLVTLRYQSYWAGRVRF